MIINIYRADIYIFRKTDYVFVKRTFPAVTMPRKRSYFVRSLA